MTSPTETTTGDSPGTEPRSRQAERSAHEVIRTEALTKIYPGDIRAVDGLDLSVGRGEIFGLLGPNGAGKTTTAGMLTARVIPTSGKALVGDVDVVAHPALAKRLIGVVPQSNTLDRSLSVWNNLYFHGRFFGMSAKQARARTDQMLEQFRLADRGKAPVLALSGGMAQRLMVARAVMHNPSILFLDEPTAGLDPQSRIALWEILGELHGDGQTILLTTHYMEEADELCNRLAIVDHGKMLALGTPRQLKDSMGIDTSVLVTVAGDPQPVADMLVAEVPGATEAHVVDGKINLGVKGATGVLPAVVTLAEKHGFAVTDLSATEPTLETVFIKLTGKDLPRMTTLDVPTTPAVPSGPGPAPLTNATGWSAFKALLTRDAYVLAHNLKEFLPRTLIQPFLLVFVFTYVLPKIGLGIGGGTTLPPAVIQAMGPTKAAAYHTAAAAQASAYAASLMAGVIGSVILFQGIQAVALPLVQEFGYTREIEDRVLAPLPVELVAGEKIVSGALQCLIAALLVFPIATVVPATPIHLHITWWVLVTILPLACLMASTLGLTFGTIFDPRTVPMLFGVIVVPITFLGCIYYPWSKLSAIPWLQVVSLANPLVYISEGFRAALTNAPHMSLWAVYPVMLGFIALLTWRGIAGFKKRVIA